MAIPPLKHIIDQQVSGANISAGNQTFILAKGVVNPNSYTTATDCRNGSIITSMSIQLDITDQALNSIDFYDWYVWFNIGGAQSQPTPNSTNISVIKNQIFHQDGSLHLNNQLTAVGVYMPRIATWRLQIQIPRSFRQLNENDQIELVIRGGPNSTGTSIKLKVIYKEIFP